MRRQYRKNRRKAVDIAREILPGQGERRGENSRSDDVLPDETHVLGCRSGHHNKSSLNFSIPHPEHLMDRPR